MKDFGANGGIKPTEEDRSTRYKSCPSNTLPTFNSIWPGLG